MAPSLSGVVVRARRRPQPSSGAPRPRLGSQDDGELEGGSAAVMAEHDAEAGRATGVDKGKRKAVGFVASEDEAEAPAAEAGQREVMEDLEDVDRCAICLSEVQDKTIVSPCEHSSYCFACILAWSDQSRKCPLCLGPISHLLHNIRSEVDYQRYFPLPLPMPRSRHEEERERQMLQASVTVWTEDELRKSMPSRRGSYKAARRRKVSDEDEEEAALERRRYVYRHGLYAKHIASNAYTRFRNVAPALFAQSPDLRKKITAFLRRELRVFPSVDVEFLVTYVVSIMGQLELKSEGAIRLIGEFLGGEDRAEHFAHELSTFLRSPYTDVRTFDAIVQYGRPDLPQRPPSPPPTRPAAYRPRHAERPRSPSPRSYAGWPKRHRVSNQGDFRGRPADDGWAGRRRREPVMDDGRNRRPGESGTSLGSETRQQHRPRRHSRSPRPEADPTQAPADHLPDPPTPAPQPAANLPNAPSTADHADSDSEEDAESDVISLGFSSRDPTPPSPDRPSLASRLDRAPTPPIPSRGNRHSLRERMGMSLAAAANEAQQAVQHGPRPSDFTMRRDGGDVKALTIRGVAASQRVVEQEAEAVRAVVGEEESSSATTATSAAPDEPHPIRIDETSLASRLKARLAAEKEAYAKPRRLAPPVTSSMGGVGGAGDGQHQYSSQTRARLMAKLEEERQKAVAREEVDRGLAREEGLREQVLQTLAARREKRRKVLEREDELRLKVRLVRRRRRAVSDPQRLETGGTQHQTGTAAKSTSRLNPSAPPFVKSTSESQLKQALLTRKSGSTRESELKSRLAKLRPAPTASPPAEVKVASGPVRKATIVQRLEKEKLRARIREQEGKLQELKRQLGVQRPQP